MDREEKKYEVFPKCLDSIASICQEHGIRLILISIPQWKSAQEVMTQEGLEKKDELVKDLMDRYPCVEYHDYIFDERFTADDFDDARIIVGYHFLSAPCVLSG